MRTLYAIGIEGVLSKNSKDTNRSAMTSYCNSNSYVHSSMALSIYSTSNFTIYFRFRQTPTSFRFRFRNYCGIKLMSHTMKVRDSVVEQRFGKRVQIYDNQFGLMPEISRQILENFRDKKGLDSLILRGRETRCTETSILVGINKGIVELNLDRPESKNAIGKDMLKGLRHSLEDLNRDRSAKVMMICSSAPKVFCAGADLKERRAMFPEEVQSFVNNLRSTFSLLEAIHIPTIAVIEGTALGGGLEMALSCDLRICGENAVLGLPETGLAIIPGAGGTQRLSRLVGKSIAKDLIFTGRKISGTDAYAMGLINYCVAPGSAYPKALELAREINQKGPVAVRMAKRAINEGVDMDMASALALEEECYQHVLHTKDRLEGLAAFAEKRKPIYTGE